MKSKLVVVDMQYMFHRHLYRIRDYEEKNGNYMLSWNDKETARLFFTIKDFFEIARFAATNNADICVCLDSKSDRKEENTEYKSNRGKLSNVDVEALENIEYVLRESGFAVLKQNGYEADDLIAAVVNSVGNEYEEVIIFTPDSDLCAHIKGNVSVWRYKSVNSKYGNHGRHAEFLDAHTVIDADNYCEILSAENKTEIPYNSIMLYKSLVGDTSDHIPGVKGFGKAAFTKYVANLRRYGVNFEELCDADKVAEVINKSGFALGELGIEQALACLDLVKCRTCEEIEKQIAESDFSYPKNAEKIQSTLAEFGINSIKK